MNDKPINQITAKDIREFNSCPTLGTYQEIATKSAIYPGQGTAVGLMYASLKLNGEAGELSEHVGKAMRDDALVFTTHSPEQASPVAIMGQLMPERHALIVKEVGDVLWYLSAICNELGVNLTEAAAINLHKLHDRGNRGVLGGSGDER